MPQGQQKTWYGVNFIMQGAKVLLFVQLHICNDREMVAHFFRDS